MKVSLIVTVLNEAGSVGRLLDSVLAQTRPPDEVVIVDGGSHDATLDVIRRYADRLPLRLLMEPGANIARGRNLAIVAAGGDVMAVTDAGVRLAPDWLAALVAPFESAPPPDVVSGFFVADAEGAFETALGATTLPDVDEVDPAMFLPSSRSVAYTKAAWAAVGGYPEWLDYCEDLVFDLKLRERGFCFAWAPTAVVGFRPRPSLAAHFRQYYVYARGDGKADLWRRRHAIRYAAYAIGAVLLSGLRHSPWLGAPLAVGVAAYLWRPYRRLWRQAPKLSPLERIAAVAWTPLIRATGDIAKMVGYPVGVVWRLRRRGPSA